MQTCNQCKSPFQIKNEDKALYEKVSPIINGKKYSIPEPAMCPQCREQLRLLWKNERKLYHRKCDLCNKNIISIYSPDKQRTVYCQECWWGDKWDPFEYGKEYDPGRSFFEQFNDLLLKVPRVATHHNNNAENCEYTTSTTRNRNCYLISSSGNNEDCYYGIFMPRNKNCVDSTHVMDSEHCYECVDVDKSYNLAWCQNVKDSSDSRFLYDCHGCRNCFLCVGLRNKEYCIKNKEYKKEEYEKKISEIDFTSHSTVKKLKSEFYEFYKDSPRLYYTGQNNENVTSSDNIFNSRNCSYCFDCNNLEDCKFCGWYNDSKDSYDVYAFGYGNEKCYNSLEIGTNTTNMLMCISCFDGNSDLYYSFLCQASQNLLGCVGLKHKKYCILNKQYSKEEFENLKGQIIENMIKIGEWGQFFPSQMSNFDYNETMAQDFYPLTRDEALKQGFKWSDLPDEAPKADKVIPASRLPDCTSEIPDDVLNWAIKCEATDRPFKLIAQELKFYREHQLPIPHLHPDERYRKRFSLRNPRIISDRKCDKCGTDLKTTYPSNSNNIIYCEKCYLENIY